MTTSKRFIAIDAGNTRVKVGLFSDDVLDEVRSFSNDQLADLKTFLQHFQGTPTIISSVKSEKETKWLKQLVSQATLFSTKLKLPIQIGYETPETLGVDRVANAIAAHHLAKGACLIIDVGTCVKYDFVRSDGTYEGGAISPGVAMRFQAMHEYTGRLPLITDWSPAAVLGQNTSDALRSGVLQAIHFEMIGYMDHFLAKVPQLTIFLTGGDAQYFDLGFKNDIFVDENLTLKGLQLTLSQHDK